MPAKIKLSVDEDNRIDLVSEDNDKIKTVSDKVDMTETTIIENTNYEILENKPAIEGNTLIGDKSLDQLGITKDSLGINPNSIGLSGAGEYAIYMLFHS